MSITPSTQVASAVKLSQNIDCSFYEALRKSSGWMLCSRVISIITRMIVNKCIVVCFFIALVILEVQILRSNAPSQNQRENGRTTINLAVVLISSILLCYPVITKWKLLGIIEANTRGSCVDILFCKRFYRATHLMVSIC